MSYGTSMYERFHKSGHNSNSTRYEQQPNDCEKFGESKIYVNYLVECFTFPSTEHTVSFETKSPIESKIILTTKISPFLFTHSRISLMLVVLFGVKMTMDPMKKRPSNSLFRQAGLGRYRIARTRVKSNLLLILDTKGAR